MGGGKSQYQPDSTIYGVIQSLVSVEEYKKKGNLDLYEEIFEKRLSQTCIP